MHKGTVKTMAPIDILCKKGGTMAEEKATRKDKISGVLGISSETVGESCPLQFGPFFGTLP
jgi:hypothetical protein